MGAARSRAHWAGVIVSIAVLAAGLAACDDDDGDDASPAEAEVVASTGCETGEGGDGRHDLVHDGIPREYVVHLPDGYDGETPAPLVLNLHGLGSNIEQQDGYTGMPALAGERGYIVVTPQGEELQLTGFEGRPFWNVFVTQIDTGGEEVEGLTDPEPSELGADDVGFFTELTDLLLEEYCVDPDRVFSAGMSNGAGMSVVLGCELDGRIKAIAPVTGVNITDVCTGDEHVSVLAIHGDADEIVAYEGNYLIGFELGNPSVPDRMDQWATHNGCDAEPVVSDEGDGIVVSRWEGCEGGVEVELWTLQGWGHAWPQGGEPTGPDSIRATTLILDFFDRASGN